MADVASDYGLELPPMPEAAQAELLARLPFCAPRNPVDITAQAFNQMELFASNLDIVVEQGGYDAIAAFFTTVPGSPPSARRSRPRCGAARAPSRKAHRAVHAGAAGAASRLRERRLSIFEDANRAVRAVAGLRFFAEAFGGRPARCAAPVQLPAIPALPAKTRR